MKSEGPGIRVGDVMTRNFVYIKPDSNLLDCSKTMIKKRVGSLVLKNRENLYGVLTEKDIIWALSKRNGKNIGSVLAKDVATKKTITIRPEAKIEEALNKMNKYKIRRMPVMVNKKIVGYVTLKDIVKFIPSIFESNREFEIIREESEKIKRSKSAMKGEFLEASCEECGNYDMLHKVDGRMICESCKDVM